jgi:hypothetical protein
MDKDEDLIEFRLGYVEKLNLTVLTCLNQWLLSSIFHHRAAPWKPF